MKQELIEAIQQAAEVVASTYGPNGKKVFSRKDFRFTKDGMIVARMYADSVEGVRNSGAKLLLDACQRTAQVVGDSTTLTALLVSELLKHELSDLAGSRDTVVKYLEDTKIMPDKDQLIQAVTTSVNGDEALGKMIAELVFEIGHKASVRGIPALGAPTSVEIIPGYQCGGVAHMEFLRAKHVQKAKASFGVFQPMVILYENLFADPGDLKKILDVYKHEYHGRPLVVIAPKFEDIVIKMALKNQENFPLTLVHLVEDRPESYHDLEAGTGAKIIAPYAPAINKRSFGEADMLEVRPDGSRITFLPKFREALSERSDRTDRIGQLNQGVGVIYIGGQTEAEHGYLNDAIEDGVMAAQSCLRYGILPGAGSALFQAASHISGPLSKALMAPAQKLPPGEVFDPAEGLIKAIEHAVSLVSEIVNTEYVI